MSVYQDSFSDALYEELERQKPPSRWLMLKARLLGRHMRTTDCGFTVHSVRYQHHIYILSIKESKV